MAIMGRCMLFVWNSWLLQSTVALVCLGFSHPAIRIRTSGCRLPRVRPVLYEGSFTTGRTARTDAPYDTWDTLLEHFSGDFDNYYQVLEDRRGDLLPREGGGHEHMHCTLIPVGDDKDPHPGRNPGPTETSARLAAFYFEGMPQRIFRFRQYQLQLTVTGDSVDMILHTLHPDLEAKLREAIDPVQWPGLYHDFANDRLQKLPRCDVRWSRAMDPVQHEYALQHPLAHRQQQDAAADQHHAVMVYGQAIVNSTMIPGTQILIKDQLSLWADDFWIHDRGYDVSTGEFVYGNQRNVPYQLKRVTRIQKNGQRRVVNADLEWTLGSDWRTTEEYERRMARIGGVSTRMNTANSKAKS